MILIFDSKGVSFGGWNSNFSEDNKFHEKLTYDLRGNIITLQRNGLNSNGWTGNNFVAGTYGRIDNLTYAYNTKNQLLSVNEASLPTRGFKTNPNATGDQYGYDGNGNLTYDKNKYITSIEYNYLNLPIRIVIQNPTDAGNSGSIEFVYDATGVKLRKTVKNKDGSVKETWDYVNGVEYKNQILQRVAHSEGAVVRNDFGQYQHEYALRDHLGNTRVTFTDGVNKGEPYWDWSNYSYIQPDNTGYDDGVVTEADIKHINHTYPFGMAMEGNWNNAGSANNNRYLYNGKQWNDDFGMGWNDYGARFYDPAIARWSVIDPLSEISLQHNPYNYVANNPIKFIDPDGMQTEGYISGKKGQLYHDKTVHSQKDLDKKYGEKSGLKYEGEEILLKDKAGNRYYGDKDGNVTGTTKEEYVCTDKRVTIGERLYSFIPATVSVGGDVDAIAGTAFGASIDFTMVFKGKNAWTPYVVASTRMGAGGPVGADISGHFSVGWLTGRRKFQQSLTASDILDTKLAYIPDGMGGLKNTDSNSGYLSINVGEGVGGTINLSHSSVGNTEGNGRYLTAGLGYGAQVNLPIPISVSGGTQNSKIVW